MHPPLFRRPGCPASATRQRWRTLENTRCGLRQVIPARHQRWLAHVPRAESSARHAALAVGISPAVSCLPFYPVYVNVLGPVLRASPPLYTSPFLYLLPKLHGGGRAPHGADRNSPFDAASSFDTRRRRQGDRLITHWRRHVPALVSGAAMGGADPVCNTLQTAALADGVRRGARHHGGCRASRRSRQQVDSPLVPPLPRQPPCSRSRNRQVELDQVGGPDEGVASVRRARARNMIARNRHLSFAPRTRRRCGWPC